MSVEELNQRLAEIYKEAEAANLQINDDWELGCPPCGTVEDLCVGCPYALREFGYSYKDREYRE